MYINIDLYNITSFVLISQLEKDHSTIETRQLKNPDIFSKHDKIVLLTKTKLNTIKVSISKACRNNSK